MHSHGFHVMHQVLVLGTQEDILFALLEILSSVERRLDNVYVGLGQFLVANREVGLAGLAPALRLLHLLFFLDVIRHFRVKLQKQA